MGVDLRAAAMVARRHASLLVAAEAAAEPDPTRRRQIEAEAIQLWQGEGRR